MANGQTTSTQIPAAVQEFYDAVLLERALANIVHDKFGQMKPVKMNSGEQPKFRRYTSLTNVTQPLVEGITPTPQQLAKTDVTGQLEQYGTYVEGTDYVIATSQDAVLTEVSTMLGENAGESLDLIYRDALVAGTSKRHANGVASRTDIVSAQLEADYKKIVRALMNAKAKPWLENIIAGSDKVGTTPIAKAYYAIVDEYAYYDLLGISNFIPVAKYPDGGSSAMVGELGSLGHIRFVLCQNGKVWADGGGAIGSTGLASTGSSLVDVHCALIFGQNAYGITALQGKALEMIYKDISQAGGPLNQAWTSGWKACTDLVILNETFMYRYEFGVTA